MKIKLLSILLTSTVSSVVFAAGVTTQQSPATQSSGFYQSTINQLNQNADEGSKNELNTDWLKYISISGALYADAKAGDLNYDTQGENNERFSVTNANLALQATPNTWSRVTVVGNFSDASDNYVPDPAGTNFNTDDQKGNEFYIDQAYVTFGDEARYPVFAQVGTQYLPFGQYDINPIVKSLSQVLTETQATDAQVGFVTPEGLYGSTYAFQNSVSSDGDGANPVNGGAVLGFKKSDDQMIFDTGVGYLNNMSGVNAIYSYMDQYNVGYGSSVAALAPYASFQTGPFGIKADYVTALSYFDKASLPYEVTSDNGAKPSAIDSQVSYAFNLREMDHVLFVGYQVSDQASALNLPKKRYDVGYNVYPLKNVLLGLEVTRDTNYSAGNVGDTADGDDYYTYNARIGVQF